MTMLMMMSSSSSSSSLSCASHHQPLSLSRCRGSTILRSSVFRSKTLPQSELLLSAAQKKRKFLRMSFTSASLSPTGQIEKLQNEVSCAGVKVEEGEGALPKVVIVDSSGSQAEIYIFGACVTSWKLANSKDLLFVRPDAVFNGQKPISGGIPHCFPQFGPGPIQQHGFARNLPWSIAGSENVDGSPSVTFELKDNEYTRGIWDHGFLATYQVSLAPTKLSTKLVIKNTDDKPFSFTTALHTYFRASVTDAAVKGLKGCETLNKVPDPVNPIRGIEEREIVNFPGFVDCIYLSAPEELFLTNGLGDTLSISNKNWPDAVLWNPHVNAPAAYKDFVCVENAKIQNPATLHPGEVWEAEQILSVC